MHAMLAAGGLDAVRADGDALRTAVEFGAACGAFTTTRPGAIDAQPTAAQAAALAAAAAAEFKA